MLKQIFAKLRLEISPSLEREYLGAVRDILANEKVRSMREFTQHGGVSCLEHSLYVSCTAFLVCRKLGLDSRCAARGGLLHDFFLYDWHTDRPPFRGLHGIIHPRVSLGNALRYFPLNKLEREIIARHMWPLTLTPPAHRETLVVCMADKYCAFMEWADLSGMRHVKRICAQFS